MSKRYPILAIGLVIVRMYYILCALKGTALAELHFKLRDPNSRSHLAVQMMIMLEPYNYRLNYVVVKQKTWTCWRGWWYCCWSSYYKPFLQFFSSRRSPWSCLAHFRKWIAINKAENWPAFVCQSFVRTANERSSSTIKSRLIRLLSENSIAAAVDRVDV